MPSKRNKKNKSKSKTADTANHDELEQQLQAAQAAIESSRKGIAQLHQQWKSSLLKLSYIVVMVSIHQATKPMTECWEDTTTAIATTAQRLLFVAADSLQYLLGIFMALLLMNFLKFSSESALVTLTSHPTFLLANACLPVVVALYYIDGVLPEQTCLETAWFLKSSNNNTSTTTEEEEERQRRGFPVVVVFSAIVTACYVFMSRQAKQQDRNQLAVTTLREELEKRKKKA